MKTIKVIQNAIGKFNLASPLDESVVFIAAIQEGGKTVERNGVPCKIYINSDDLEDHEAFSDYVKYSDWEALLDLAIKYSNRVISSTDYEAQCVAFAGEYIESLEEIKDSSIEQERLYLERQIELLRERLTNLAFTDQREEVRNRIDTFIARYPQWISLNEKELADYVPDSPKRADIEKRNARHKAKFDRLSSLLPEPLQ